MQKKEKNIKNAKDVKKWSLDFAIALVKLDLFRFAVKVKVSVGYKSLQTLYLELVDA